MPVSIGAHGKVSAACGGVGGAAEGGRARRRPVRYKFNQTNSSRPSPSNNRRMVSIVEKLVDASPAREPICYEREHGNMKLITCQVHTNKTPHHMGERQQGSVSVSVLPLEHIASVMGQSGAFSTVPVVTISSMSTRSVATIRTSRRLAVRQWSPPSPCRSLSNCCRLQRG